MLIILGSQTHLDPVFWSPGILNTIKHVRAMSLACGQRAFADVSSRNGTPPAGVKTAKLASVIRSGRNPVFFLIIGKKEYVYTKYLSPIFQRMAWRSWCLGRNARFRLSGHGDRRDRSLDMFSFGRILNG